MYEAYFGLHSRPFGTKAEGPAVFTGPQQAQTIRGLHLGLVAQDAVVTVTGPTGVGKTTIVGKALASIKPNRMAAWIGRMHLSPDELLDLLLAGFGAGKPVQGSIRRFTLFRRIMAQRAAAGSAIAVVVEDARRLGVEALAELEALTAADTGDSAGANIILMGPPDLAGFLKDPALARLRQRVRRREKVGEFSQAEISGYLRHCLRQAGGDYDAIFDNGVDQIIYRCSEGVARVINTLAENVLQAAAEKGLKRVATGLMHEVASDNYTYEGPPPAFPAGSDIDWEAPPRTEAVDAADAENDSLVPDEKDLPPSARNIVVESGRYPELPEVAETVPVVAAPGDREATRTPAKAAATDEELEIPELINDTQPELSALPMPKSDEAVTAGNDAESRPAAVPGAPVEPGAKTHDGAADEEEKFDLDAALSIDVEATNVMEGITPNLEKLAADAARNQPGPVRKAPPPADDLPTLSNSMRVDVAREVKRAQQPELAAKPAPAVPKAKPAPAGLHAKATDAVPGTDMTPAAPKKDAVKVSPKRPATPVVPRPALPTPAAAVQPADAGPDEDAGPAVLEPEPEFLAMMDPKPEPETKPAPPTAAEPKQSEMTRRIAAMSGGRQRNEVDALEAALESAKKRSTDDLLSAPPVQKGNGVAAPAPRITLDIELSSTQKRRKDELHKAAAEISRAKALEEFSDKMAETLFGDEDLDAIAAEVIANPPPGYEALSGEQATVSPPDPGPSPVKLDEPLAGLEIGLVEEPSEKPAQPASKRVAPPRPHVDGLRESQALRADILGSMSRRAEPAPKRATPAARSPQPESIENQINTSITQRMAALDLSRLADGDAGDSEDREDKKPGGFFSRFRRSS